MKKAFQDKTMEMRVADQGNILKWDQKYAKTVIGRVLFFSLRNNDVHIGNQALRCFSATLIVQKLKPAESI